MPLTLSELAPDELLAFVGLAKLMIRADQHTSDPELASLQRIGEQVGEAWLPAVQMAKMSIQNRDDVWAMAQGVTRPEAQALIHGELAMIAFCDALVPAETGLLTQLAELWKL